MISSVKDLLRPFYQSIRYRFYKIRYREQMPKILSIEETLSEIIANNVSISRYGDGELNIMCGGSIGFCHQDNHLKLKLIEVATNPIPNHIVCLPPMLKTLKGLTPKPKQYWKNLLAVEYPLWFRFIKKGYVYGNAFISRFYMDFQNPKFAQKTIDKWRRIWDGRDCILVEGINTRMGMGNDLFDNAKSIRRILCPPTDAYKKYDEILIAVKKHFSKEENSLILIALGPVATVLSYDLCKAGIQALDTGHLDIEYEWLLHKAKNKINISTKAVNEYKNGGLDVTDDITISYTNQIILKIE